MTRWPVPAAIGVGIGLGLGLALLAIVGCGVRPPQNGGATVELLEVPHPNFEHLGPLVVEQIESRVDALLQSEEDAEPDDSQRAVAFGELGRVYQAYGFVDAAEAAYRNAHSLNPSAVRWPYLLGYLLQAAGRLEESVPAFEAARRESVGDPAVLLRLGMVLRELGRIEESVEVLRVAARIKGAEAAAEYELGRAAAQQEDHTSARDHLERALELQPGATLIHYGLGQSYRELGKIERAREHLGQAGDLAVSFPDPEVRGLEELATGLSVDLRTNATRIYRGDVQTAETNLRRTVEAHPESVEARLLLGAALLALKGRREEGRQEFEEAMRLAPDSPYVHFAFGFELAKTGAWDEAAASFRRAIELAPDHEDAHANLAVVLARQGKHEGAITHFEEVLRIDPRQAQARVGRGESLLELGRLDEALADFRAVVGAEPSSSAARLGVASALERSGDVPGAAREFQDAVALELPDAEHTWLAFKHGLFLGRQGRHAEALESFRRSVERDPEFVDARFNLGVSLMRQRAYREALEQFQSINGKQPHHSGARSGAGAALINLGRYRDAATNLEQGLVLEPQNALLASDLARLLATCPDPAVLDGRRALELAEPVFANSRSAGDAEVLAMALAAAGRFDEAAVWQRRLIAAAEQSGQDGVGLGQLRKNLARYEQGQICCG